MGFKRKLFDSTTNTLVKLLGLNKANRITSGIAEKIQPIHRQSRNGVEYVLYCPNNFTRWRAETFFSKEPETIEWIDSFQKGDILFDVGGNVGLYTIYAAKRGHEVYTFEPESLNYGLINKNVYLNDVSDKVTNLNIGLSDENGVLYLYIPTFQAGGALNNLGEAKDWQHKSFKEDFKQAVLAFSLDYFLEKYAKHFPTHLKIDVDGVESKIIHGAEKTLKDNRLKSLLIELNEELPEDIGLIDFIENCGLKLKHKKHSDLIDKGKFKNVYNFIFYRN